MTAKADIYMPVFLGDYQKHTKRLTTEQHGCYFLLMQDYWINGPPPDDDGVLARITGCSEHSWSTNRAALEKFFVIENGIWRQKRIDSELDKAATRKDKAIAAANAKQARIRAQQEDEEKRRQPKMKGARSTRQAPVQGVPHGCPSSSTYEVIAHPSAITLIGGETPLLPHGGQEGLSPGKPKNKAERDALASEIRESLGIKKTRIG